MNKIDHPNIIKMIDVYENKENFFIILEFMKGGELFEWIVEKDHFTEKEAVKILKILLDAVGYCH